MNVFGIVNEKPPYEEFRKNEIQRRNAITEYCRRAVTSSESLAAAVRPGLCQNPAHVSLKNAYDYIEANGGDPVTLSRIDDALSGGHPAPPKEFQVTQDFLKRVSKHVKKDVNPSGSNSHAVTSSNYVSSNFHG